MCETPKDEAVDPAKQEKEPPKSYYYDDAHGYQDFDPESDEPENEDDDEEALA